MRQPGSIYLDVPADVECLHVPDTCLGTLIEDHDALVEPQDLIYNLRLAVYEVCTNIMLHAYRLDGLSAEEALRGRIRIVFTIAFQPQTVIIDFYDTGSSFDLSSIPEPQPAAPQTQGYGLYLVRQLVDEVIYEPEPGSNHWRLTKHL